MTESSDFNNFTSSPDSYRRPIFHETQFKDKRDYHNFLDETCFVPGKNPDLNTDGDGDETLLSPKGKAILAGLIAFIYIALFVWLADRFGPVWAAIFGSIPGTLLAAIFFTEEKKVPSLVFGLLLGGVAALAAAAIFYWLITSTGLDKSTVLIVSAIIWVIIIGLLVFGFRKKLESTEH